MNDEQNLLASAYLDGALTSEERARAEADPEVMAAVERLGELRRALAVFEPADPARRDVAIQAALDAFDIEAAPRAPVTPLASRRFGGWLVSAAAAALVVVVVGGILAVGNSGGDDDDDGAAGGAATAGTLTAGDSPLLADTGPTEQRDSDQGGQEAESGAAGTTAAAAVPGATYAPATTNAGSDATITATYSALLLSSPDELAQFADDALRAGATSSDVARTSCDEGRPLGAAIYDVDGVATAVEVFLAEDDSEVLAVDASTCEIVARAPAP
jgi:hypothetical protein